MDERPHELITSETIATYRAGPPTESADFDFLLGSWATHTTRFASGGEKRRAHDGAWTARHLAGGRIVLDETTAVDSNGVQISSMATLRTYSPVTKRWEMTFLSAHQPILPISLVGTRMDNEIHLDVRLLGVADAPVLARLRFFDITTDHFAWEQQMSRDGGHSFDRTILIRAERT